MEKNKKPSVGSTKQELNLQELRLQVNVLKQQNSVLEQRIEELESQLNVIRGFNMMNIGRF